MKLHIKIPTIIDFFFVVTKEDPVKTEIVEVEKQSDPSKLDEEQMEHNLDRVNMWIGNCDQKASFLLAVVGVMLSIIFTSESLVSSIKTILVEPFLQYYNNHVGSFCCFRFLIAVFLILGSVSMFCALLFLLMSLSAKTDSNRLKKENPGLEDKSLLFYGSISNMSYSDYSSKTNDKYNDYRSQVYINSKICIKKFNRYKRGLKLTIVATLLLTPAFVMLLFA